MLQVKNSLLIMLSAAFLFFGCDSPNEEILGPGDYTRTINYQGLERTYDVHVPVGYTGTSPVPLVFDIHGLAMTPSMMDQMTGFRAKADEEGFIVVQPAGEGNSWNGGWCCGSAASDGLDDVGLMRAILEELTLLVYIDMKRVYADGMSNGGFMSNRIACEDPGLVAAIGPVVGGIGFDTYEECSPDRPMPVLLISGSEDMLIDIESQIATFNRWLDINGCTDEYTTEVFGIYTCTKYQNCDAGVEAIHCIGDGEGHCWPGTDFNLWPCSQDLNATDLIWDFFTKYRIP